MSNDIKYVVIDKNGKFIAYIYDDEPCKPYTSQRCGGCSDCLYIQALHCGYKVIEYICMNDGTDHPMCKGCGMCILCGDCHEYGCGFKETEGEL